MTAHDLSLSRRSLLKGAGALVIGLHLPLPARAQSGAGAAFRPGGNATFAPNAFVRVAPDSTVTVLIKHIEFGQGPFTGLATLVAEEMDAAWSQMRSEHAPADVKLYANLAFGVQGTGGSTAIANSWEQMRKAGAAARTMLVQAAAAAWKVPVAEIKVEAGVISHASGKQGSFGEFAEAASKLPVPENPPLKPASAYRLIGKEGAVKRLDSADKARGKAQFTIDIHAPSMLTVVVARPPRFGGKVASFDASQALKVKGVVDVKQIGSGVAVYATGFDTVVLLRLHAAGASDAEFEESVRERDERRRHLLAALVRRMAKGGHPRAKSLKDLIDVLFALTSLAFFAQLASEGRSTDAACRLIQALSEDAVRRAGLGPD